MQRRPPSRILPPLAPALAVALVVLGAGAARADGIGLASEAPFADPAAAPQLVREGCELQTRIPGYVGEYHPEVRLGAEGSRRLVLRITGVHAPGGGMWSGPKWIALEGELVQGERRVADFRARRTSVGGPFAPFMDTCAILNRCARALGRDVAAWLDDPAPGARLGDAP